jgi:hypothetical protein
MRPSYLYIGPILNLIELFCLEISLGAAQAQAAWGHGLAGTPAPRGRMPLLIR